VEASTVSLVERVEDTTAQAQQSAEPRAAAVTLRYAGLLVLVAASYFVTGKFGQQFALLHPSVTMLWTPSGISIAAFLLGGYRMWPAILAGAFLVNVSTTGAVRNSLEIVAGNLLEGLTAAYLVREYAGGTRAFLRPHSVFRYAVFAGLFATAISATVGVSVLCQDGLAQWKQFGSVWFTWWLGDMLGALVLAPFLIVLLAHKPDSVPPAGLPIPGFQPVAGHCGDA
jgi:integral membrane sensor domain MASE1